MEYTDKDREEQTHRLRNRKKSNSAKQAWKKHHYNYMRGNRKKSRDNMNSFYNIAREIEENVKIIESKIEKDNVFDLSSSITFDNIAGGLSFSIDKNTGMVSFATYLSEQGKGNYKVENGSTSENELRVLYDGLKDDLNTLCNSIDNNIQQILAKYGLKSTL